MKVLVVGSGGREHALAWKLLSSPRVDSIVSCPGNGGLAALGDCWSTPHPVNNPDGLIERIRKENIDLVVIGPEDPLVAGLADRLRAERIPTFGPGRSAARLEGSKAFAKDFMGRHGIPTAGYRVVSSTDELDAALAEFEGPVVVKASGLAAGKGVSLTEDGAEARRIATAMLSGSLFGDSGRTVVLEECLRGVELTMLVFVSGRDFLLLEPAQDYKPLDEGNQGPNTGGMGAYSPSHMLTDALRERVIREVLEPTLAGFEQEDIPYQGLLYLGLMVTPDGTQVLEYNVRFGDPETQPLMMRLRTDLIDVFEAIESGTLSRLALQWDPRAAVCVVLASRGYPLAPDKGAVIAGPVESALEDDLQVFHAGTARTDAGLVTAGGRVLGVTALGDTVADARDRAYARVHEIQWDGLVYRRDIARLTGGEA